MFSQPLGSRSSQSDLVFWFEDRAREDDERRYRAGEFAREREKGLAEVMGERRIQLARFEERLAAQTARVEEQHRARR